eukprot:COSAG01_NODE_3715_length_5769_cov_2.903175_3_plen_111_part_00
MRRRRYDSELASVRSPAPTRWRANSLKVPAAPFRPSIFLDKNRGDRGKSQSIWTDPKAETAGSRCWVPRPSPATGRKKTPAGHEEGREPGPLPPGRCAPPQYFVASTGGT